jgi:hypothetical protein
MGKSAENWGLQTFFSTLAEQVGWSDAVLSRLYRNGPEMGRIYTQSATIP